MRDVTNTLHLGGTGAAGSQSGHRHHAHMFMLVLSLACGNHSSASMQSVSWQRSWIQGKGLLGTSPLQTRIFPKLPGSSDTQYTTSQRYPARLEGNLQTQEVLISTLVLLLFNSRMQLRIHRGGTQPSQGEPADTAHCCVGVDALHEVCCCNVWERGWKLNAHA